MRWMWIDTITVFEPKTRMVAIKNVSMAEEHLHAHFAKDADGPALPLMPNSLMYSINFSNSLVDILSGLFCKPDSSLY